MIREVHNLKLLLVKDGFTDEEIKKIIGEDDKRYKNYMEKSLCRLYCHGEKGRSALYLVPWCFDKIKQFKKER
jgi:hypothetical protein